MRELNRDGEWVDSENPAPAGPPRTVRELFAIARYQRVLLFCILIHLSVGLIGTIATPKDPPLVMQVLAGVFAITLISIEVVFVFRLATKVFGTGSGIALAIFIVVPCVGLILLLVINGRATSVLNEYGIRVGLLGARSSDLEALRRPRRSETIEEPSPRRKARRVEDDEDRGST